MQDTTTLNLILVDIAMILGLCNAPLWLGAIAAGVFRYLRERDNRQYKATIRSLQQNIQVVSQNAKERVRLAEMEAAQRERRANDRRVMLALLDVYAREQTMSHKAAARHGMTRDDWERACHLLIVAKVGERDGRGSVRLVCSSWDARDRALDWLASLPDYPAYVAP